MVKVSGPNRSAKITDHFTCISANDIYCITCTLCKKMIYIGKTGRRLADCFREHLPDVETETTQMPQNQLHAIFIFLITLTTWLFAAYPYTTETQKAVKISNKSLFFNWAHSIHTESMNASHSINLLKGVGKTPIFVGSPKLSSIGWDGWVTGLLSLLRWHYWSRTAHAVCSYPITLI